MKINNFYVYGIDQSIKASGYPMSTEITDVTDNNKEELEKGYERANRLSSNPPGTGHNNFLKGIIIQADITATIKWWVQWGRYHFSDITSSQSTIHRLKGMRLSESYCKWVDQRMINIMKILQVNYKTNPTKENFYKMIYSNPAGMELTARVSSNYLQEKTIYQQRRNHKLEYEWGYYCDWIEELPYSNWIIKNSKEETK